MIELVFPGNAAELQVEAKKLGYNEVILCYKKPPKNTEGTVAILLSDRKSINALRKQADLLIGPCKREFFEDKRIDMILGPGLEPRKDHTHFRRSLTQVEAKIAKEQGKTVLFNFSDLLKSKRPEELLGRWRQDAKILKKYGVPFHLVSGARDVLGMRSRKDLEAIWRT